MNEAAWPSSINGPGSTVAAICSAGQTNLALCAHAASRYGTFFPGTRAQPHAVVKAYHLPGANPRDINTSNTTMETYQQDLSSCMACHHAVSDALGRDFVAFTRFEADADGMPRRRLAPLARCALTRRPGIACRILIRSFSDLRGMSRPKSVFSLRPCRRHQIHSTSF